MMSIPYTMYLQGFLNPPSHTMSREARQRETKRDRKFLLSDPFSIEIVISHMDIFMVLQVMLMVNF